MEENEKCIDFKELTVTELVKGYIKEEEKGLYTCIFCGETFEEGVIYSNHDRMVTAEKAVIEHVEDEHEGAFTALLNLDKQICGLTDIQKNLLVNMYEQNDNKIIGENMNISAATVRTHKFNLQKAKREAKILLALIDTVEDEESLMVKKAEKLTGKGEKRKETKDNLFAGNSLHPFFTQFKYR